MASSSIFPFVFVGFAFLSDAKAKYEELFGPSERRGRFAIVLGVVVVFDITQGGSFLHKKPTMMMLIHTKDKVETFEKKKKKKKKKNEEEERI